MPVIRILENGSIVENSSRKAKFNMFRIVAPAIGLATIVLAISLTEGGILPILASKSRFLLHL